MAALKHVKHSDVILCLLKTNMDAEVQFSTISSAPQWAAEHVLVDALITVLSSLPSHRICSLLYLPQAPLLRHLPLVPTLFFFSLPISPNTIRLMLFVQPPIFISIEIHTISTLALLLV